jgi:hypothetical protein
VLQWVGNKKAGASPLFSFSKRNSSQTRDLSWGKKRFLKNKNKKQKQNTLFSIKTRQIPLPWPLF